MPIVRGNCTQFMAWLHVSIVRLCNLHEVGSLHMLQKYSVLVNSWSFGKTAKVSIPIYGIAL